MRRGFGCDTVAEANPDAWVHAVSRAWRAPTRGLQDASALEKILQQRVAVLGQDRFGMELHAFDRMLAMAQAHDLLDAAAFKLCPGGDLQAFRQAFALDHQRVIA